MAANVKAQAGWIRMTNAVTGAQEWHQVVQSEDPCNGGPLMHKTACGRKTTLKVQDSHSGLTVCSSCTG